MRKTQGQSWSPEQCKEVSSCAGPAAGPAPAPGLFPERVPSASEGSLSSCQAPGTWRRELQGCDGQGSCSLQTHLAEAAKAGQCRFVERKVSHCGRGERRCKPWAGCSPRASSSVHRSLCGRPGGLVISGLGGLWPLTSSPANSLLFQG